MNVIPFKKSITGRLRVLVLPLLLLFGLLAAPSAQARDREHRRGGDRHQDRGRGGHRYDRGRGGRGYDRGRYDRHRSHRGYYRRYHGHRYWYEGGRYYDGPGGLIINLGF